MNFQIFKLDLEKAEEPEIKLPTPTGSSEKQESSKKSALHCTGTLHWKMIELVQKTLALISHASKVMLKILQARLQQYVNCELPDVQAGFRKAEEPEIKLPTSVRIIKKAREFQKNIYFCFIDYAKAFD